MPKTISRTPSCAWPLSRLSRLTASAVTSICSGGRPARSCSHWNCYVAASAIRGDRFFHFHCGDAATTSDAAARKYSLAALGRSGSKFPRPSLGKTSRYTCPIAQADFARRALQPSPPHAIAAAVAHHAGRTGTRHERHKRPHRESRVDPSRCSARPTCWAFPGRPVFSPVSLFFAGNREVFKKNREAIEHERAITVRD